jgi:hypothetical protein
MECKLKRPMRVLPCKIMPTLERKENTMNEVGAKKCTRCGKVKELNLFPLASTCKDGYRKYCIACKKEAQDIWRSKNKEHHALKGSTWAKNNKDKRIEIQKRYRDTNIVKCKSIQAQWRTKNKTLVNLSTALRRRRIRQATPRWANKEKIKEIYLTAIGLGLEVDHIIPLHGDIVSGLHVECNLQLLSKSENSAKGNKYAI